MSKLSRSWKPSPELICGLVLFAVLMIHGATIGLTDDEAYYWVLAQKPALGYAYHPPMIAWLIALSQFLFGGIFGAASAVVVRLPAALCSSAVLVLALKWLRSVGMVRSKVYSAAGVLLSLAGLFALSWMMVPDLPLFLGWMLTFVSTWRICHQNQERRSDYLVLLGATTLACLSKYSAVLIAFSAFISILLWAPRPRRVKAILALFVGGLIAAVPIVIWNASHEWASILYQIRDRQEGGSLSLVRWARFWLIELFAAGPALIIFGFAILPKVFRKRFARGESSKIRIYRFVWAFAGPAAVVFCLQPLMADFKPHWALVVWWPVALALAWAFVEEETPWARWQRGYGLVLGVIVLVSCHLPIGNYLVYSLDKKNPDPRLDVTNDLFGWERLRAFLKAQPGDRDLSIPVVGSRYQTASQAYFALGKGASVTLLPRDLKSRDEWPDLHLTRSVGPDWSTLLKPVFFVTDIRYDAPPEFRNADCDVAGKVQENRAGHLAKWIKVWKCEPKAIVKASESTG